jgi:hypothetical protein
MTELIWSFSPWIVFLLTARLTNVGVATGVGAIAAVIVLVRAVANGHLHLLDVVGPLYFAALAAVLIVVHPAHLDDWSRYAQAGSHAALTFIVFASILVGRPFTASYARETTPREYWHTAAFEAVNRRISSVWGLAFLVGTVSLIVAGTVDVRQVLLRIIVPFGSLLLAYKYTQARIADHDDSGDTQPSIAS